MRTAEELDSMQAHPASRTDGRTDAGDQDAASPYRSFFEALEELEDNKALYGKTSLEADIARRRVADARERAVAEWRIRQAA